MNHDYAHCMDYSTNCPKDCFRARLTKEALDKHYAIVSFMHFEGTDECKRKDGRNEQAKIQEGQSNS